MTVRRCSGTVRGTASPRCCAWRHACPRRAAVRPSLRSRDYSAPYTSLPPRESDEHGCQKKPRIHAARGDGGLRDRRDSGGDRTAGLSKPGQERQPFGRAAIHAGRREPRAADHARFAPIRRSHRRQFRKQSFECQSGGRACEARYNDRQVHVRGHADGRSAPRLHDHRNRDRQPGGRRQPDAHRHGRPDGQLVAMAMFRFRERGFTLVEMLVTVSLIGVLLAIAAPGMRQLSLNQGVKTAAFDIFSALIYARSEAIKRPGETVTLLPVSTSGGQWLTSFKVTDGAGDTLRTWNVPSSIELTDKNSTPVTSIVFGKDG